jgi:acyl carrier protein
MGADAAMQAAELTRDEILARLQVLLKDALRLESTASLQPQARFVEDLHTDSLAMVDIVLTVEEGFGVKLRSDLNFFEQVRTVGDAADLIQQRLGAASGDMGAERHA